MPESISSCGELKAPPHSATSRCARMISVVPPRRTSTPVARLSSSTTRRACAPVITVRLGRFITGCRYAAAAEQRSPFFAPPWNCVTW
jgi:hypothetical protein